MITFSWSTNYPSNMNPCFGSVFEEIIDDVEAYHDHDAEARANEVPPYLDCSHYTILSKERTLY